QLPRQVLRLLRRLPARLDLADHRRRRRDRRLALLLPRDRAGDVHAALGGAAARAGRGVAAARAAAPGLRGRLPLRHRRVVLRGAADHRPGPTRGAYASLLRTHFRRNYVFQPMTDERRLSEAERTNREIYEHVKRTRERLAKERREIERVRNSIADNREHIELTQRFLRD